MCPTLQPGDRVWCRERPLDRVPLGALVVVRSPRPGLLLVKRLRSRGTETFSVASDNPLDATDSRELGSLDPEALIGEVTMVRDPDGRMWASSEPG